MESPSPEDMVQEMVAAVLFTSMKMYTDRGITPQRAMRMVVQEHLQKTYGNQAWRELGIPMRTIERWRQENRQVMADLEPIEDEMPTEMLDVFARLNENKGKE